MSFVSQAAQNPFAMMTGGQNPLSGVGTAFSGVMNNFNPNTAYAPGTQATTQDLTPQIATANSNYGTANSGFDSLASAVNSRMSGQTPSLSGQLLNNATGANVAGQAALMAGQRGASSNVGLIGRQIANQGAGIQQQAAGQDAANQLAENQANTQALTNIYGTQGQLANSNLATNQQALASQNQNIVGNYSGINNVRAAIASQNAATNQGLVSGAAGAIQKGAMMLADGGAIPGFGGGSGNWNIPGFQTASMINFGSGGSAKPSSGSDPMSGATGIADVAGGPMDAGGMGDMAGGMAVAAKGGTMHLPFRPKDMRAGGTVKASAPQQQATVPGNSYANDKIPAMVSEGETVIDRDTMADPGPMGQMARALTQHINAKRGSK